MESRISALTANIEQEFNTISFEKKLLQLKDSQESINTLSAWCLDNRHHHKKIVNAWLNVLKKVKVEQRLTLFYLANDVIQYSKRKNYDFVGSWGTTLQKATTMVREEKVKNKILRIFKIWEQRGIYGEEFIADLCGLISASPMGRHPDLEPQEFQPSYLITRIRSCAKLEENTDLKLKLLKENGPKITDSDALLTSLKDRQHVEDVERDVEEGITLIEGYVNALKAEIKSRTHLIAVLTQAEAFYHTERGEVKVVNMAYRTFTTKVKNVKRKLDELIPTLGSPIPSPDINAPSPEPDSDMELPNLDMNSSTNLNHTTYNLSTSSSIYPVTDTYSAGYYNPVQSQDTQSQQNFNNSSFSSFMNSSNGPFNMQDTTNNIYPDQRQDDIYNTQPASHEMSHHHNLVQHDTLDVKISYDYGHQSQTPLLPPPMPPFTSSGYMDSYSDNNYVTADSYATSTNYQTVDSNSYTVTSDIQASYIPTTDAYNPEEEVETWEPETTWEAPPDLETPESPPIYEKEGFADPIEYDDSKIEMGLGEKDVDHRILLPPPIPPQLSDHRLPRSNSKDVDHRNLISLTGSPANDIRSPSPPQSLLPPPPAPPSLWSNSDQDYRSQDQDYRIPTIDSSIKQSSIKSSLIQIPAVETPIKPVNNNQNIVDFAQQLQLPPPPPPPPPIGKTSIKSAKKYHDNVESIDMDLSDDESSQKNCADTQPNSLVTQNNHRSDVFVNNRTCGNKEQSMLEPPPPIPQNLCDLPDISEDLPFDEDIMTGKDENEDTVEHMENHPMNMPPPVPENMMGAGPIPFIPPGNMPPNNMPPPGSIPPGNMPPGNISSGNMPPHNMPPGMPHGGMPPGALPPGGMPPGGMSLGGMPPPPPHMGDRPGGMGWSEPDWFDGRPPPLDIHNRPPFHPMFAKRHPNDFRGGFRGRGDEHGMEIFRGRGRARGFRGMRGMNNWGPNRGFIARGHRGFRGHFRGGF